MDKKVKTIIFIIIIILVIIGLVVGGIFLFRKKSTPSPSPTPTPTATPGPTPPVGPTGCQPGFEGDKCQCNMSNLANSLGSSWYCGGYSPVCNEDGTYGQSSNQMKTCSDLVNSWTKYIPYGTDYSKFNCCSNSNCPGGLTGCITTCVEGEDGIQSMFSCGCPPAPNSLQCKGCSANQICVCDGALTNNEWKCVTQQSSACPPVPKNTFCKDLGGNPATPVCVACGTNGNVLVCPGSQPDSSLLKCISTNSTPYTVWDPVTNKATTKTATISFDNSGTPIYPTFDNSKCPNLPGDGTNAIVDNSGSIQLWKAANNPPGVFTQINGESYFVPYDFNPGMQSYFYNRYQNYSGTGPSFNICNNQYGEYISSDGIYPMCWSGSVPTCQGNTGYNLNQQVLNPDGTIDYLWNCETVGGQWDQFQCKWNSNITWSDNSSLPKTSDGKDINLLPIVGCTYTDFSTGAGETGPARFDYKAC